MMRHWRLRLLLLMLLVVLLVELGLRVVVLGFVLEMLPVVSVLLGRGSSVLAHDAAVGSL
jgi:hypothetical protein